VTSVEFNGNPYFATTTPDAGFEATGVEHHVSGTAAFGIEVLQGGCGTTPKA